MLKTLTAEQLLAIGCADAWLKFAGLCTYTELMGAMRDEQAALLPIGDATPASMFDFLMALPVVGA